MLDAHPSIDMQPLLNAHLSIDRHSLLDAVWLLVAHLFPDRDCRHPHLSLCTRPFMDTLLIVLLLWLTHFIQATLAWAVSLHESKLFWLTHFFSAALVWYSTLAYQIYSRCSMYCCTSSFFHSACLCCLGHMPIILFSCSMHPACPLLRLPLFIFVEFPGQLCTLIVTHPIHVMLSLLRLQPFSSSHFLRHLCVPIFSLSVHLICHLLHVLPFTCSLFF